MRGNETRYSNLLLVRALSPKLASISISQLLVCIRPCSSCFAILLLRVFLLLCPYTSSVRLYLICFWSCSNLVPSYSRSYHYYVVTVVYLISFFLPFFFHVTIPIYLFIVVDLFLSLPVAMQCNISSCLSPCSSFRNLIQTLSTVFPIVHSIYIFLVPAFSLHLPLTSDACWCYSYCLLSPGLVMPFIPTFFPNRMSLMFTPSL